MDRNEVNNKKAPEIRVCIIDDDTAVIRTVERMLISNGYKTMGISEVIGCSAQINNFKPHLIVLDQSMPALNGDVLHDLFKKSLKHQPKIVLFSGMPPEQLEELALKMNVDDWVYKGDGFFRLVGRINMLAHELQIGNNL